MRERVGAMGLVLAWGLTCWCMQARVYYMIASAVEKAERQLAMLNQAHKFTTCVRIALMNQGLLVPQAVQKLTCCKFFQRMLRLPECSASPAAYRRFCRPDSVAVSSFKGYCLVDGNDKVTHIDSNSKFTNTFEFQKVHDAAVLRCCRHPHLSK